MRLLSPEKQADVIMQTCLFLKLHSDFRIDDRSDVGPCGSSVRIITGEEEGLFGWIAVNYLMDGFTGDNPTTYGFLDMGGASTQIAFEPSKGNQGNAKNLIDVRLRLLGGEEIHHRVFVTTWLGYGTNQARERYVGQAIDEYEKSRPEGSAHGSSTEGEVVPDPCLPKNLYLTESPVHLGPSPPHNDKSHKLRGTGSFEQCLEKTSILLNKEAPCPDTTCLMNGVSVPPIDFSVSHFIGVSEYWYSSEHVFGLGGPYDYVQYERAASKFCARDWSSIAKEHEESRQRLAGGGELEAGDEVLTLSKWSEKVEVSRLEMQCFKAAWIANVLHEGIGMPRIVDSGGDPTTSGTVGEKVAQQAENKGLGRPTFQSIDAVGDIAISWTLGKMVLEASKEVPPLLKTDKPLVDPLEDTPNIENSPIRPIRPPFIDLDAIEERLSHHLPSSLTRSSLGISPVLVILYAIMFFTIATVAYRLRRPLRGSYLRFVRKVFKQKDTEGYLMEEGITLNGDGYRPASPANFSPIAKWTRPLRRIMSFTRPRIPSPLTLSTQNSSNLRHVHNGTTPTRVSPTRSYSLPDSHTAVSVSSTQYIYPSRSPSPSSANFHHNDESANMSNSMSSITARSRTDSQINLSSLLPRQGTISRVNSTLQIPGSGTLRAEY